MICNAHRTGPHFLWSLLICYACSLAAETVSVRDFGALGDGFQDDTAAVRKALASSSSVHFPAGVYRLSDGLELPPSVRLTGEGSPRLGTFPILDDDKRFLAHDQLRQLPGTTLLFTGKGKRSLKTGRQQAFASVRYALKTSTRFPYQISDLAIVLDVQVVNSKGRPTKPAEDRRADYDVGLLVDDSPGGSLRGVSIFGYWRRAGLLVMSRGEGSNPDYNTFWNCQFSGNYGVALLGLDAAGPGLSGTQFYGCNLYSNDHHSRAPDHSGSGALFIDGDTSAKHADINGHYFFGGAIRTYHNIAVRLDRASNVTFSGVIFEVPAGKRADPSTDRTGRVVGTAQTRDVSFLGCRMHDIGLRELSAAMIDGTVTIAGNSRQGLSVQSGTRLVRLQAAANGDPMIQLADRAKSANDGWTIRLDVSDGEELSLRHGNRELGRLSTAGEWSSPAIATSRYRIAKRLTRDLRNGAITAGHSRLRIRSSQAEPVLWQIEGGIEGEQVLLEMASGSPAFQVRSQTKGNLRLPTPFTFDSPDDRLALMYTEDRWVEISRSDHAP